MLPFNNNHEHDENCGHDEETHRRIAKKMDTFMNDVAEDLFTEKDLANLYQVITSRLRKEGAGTTLPYLKAFNEGFEFGVYASSEQGSNSVQLIAGMKRIAKLKQEDIKRLATKALDKEDNSNND